jgi:hypothetical protein
MRSGRKPFDFLCCLGKIEKKTENTQLCGWRKGSALRAHSLIKQKWVDFVVVSSKLHVSERSTAPYVVSTSQPPADRTTIATLSQHARYQCKVKKKRVAIEYAESK